jgi:hypothetical protein
MTAGYWIAANRIELAAIEPVGNSMVSRLLRMPLLPFRRENR